MGPEKDAKGRLDDEFASTCTSAIASKFNIVNCNARIDAVSMHRTHSLRLLKVFDAKAHRVKDPHAKFSPRKRMSELDISRLSV